MNHVLIIDDDRDLARSLEIQLSCEGYRVTCRHSGGDGVQSAMEDAPDLVFLDLRMPDADGISVLKTLKGGGFSAPVVMITGEQDMKTTISAMREGAFDYLRKPFDMDDVFLVLEKARLLETAVAGVSEPASPSPARPPAHEIVGDDRNIIEMVKTIGLLSRSRVNVLVTGESGTGKELVARALHDAGSPGRPFVPVNCSAVVATLFESELMGHEKGAFTGAVQRKTGKLEFAQDGTLFLDEVGDTPLELQAKLLRVLQERLFERVGGLTPIPFRARVVAATNRDLEAMVRENRFREDLYFRLAVSRVHVPPVRERGGDIPLLVGHLLRRAAEEMHRPVPELSSDAMERLTRYRWPGNVRELENVLTRAVALARGPVLTPGDLSFSLGRAPGEEAVGEAVAEVVPLESAVRAHVELALRHTGWNITRTARLLEISPTTLRKKIAEYGLPGGAG